MHGRPTLCAHMEYFCLDVQDGGPSCSPDQVLVLPPVPIGSNWIDSGDGGCFDYCQCEQNLWTWLYCDCLYSFIGIDGGACVVPRHMCVGCESGWMLIGDDSNGYLCIIF